MAELSVRVATQYDLPACLEMAEKFRSLGPFRDIVSSNPQAFARWATGLLNHPKARILVGERNGFVVGLFAFLLAPHYFSEEPMAWEIFWYVEPEARGGGLGLQLLRAAEEQARSLGAVRMAMTAPSRELEALYKRCGYQPVEVSFHRKL